jgi:hypothetical protein
MITLMVVVKVDNRLVKMHLELLEVKDTWELKLEDIKKHQVN